MASNRSKTIVILADTIKQQGSREHTDNTRESPPPPFLKNRNGRSIEAEAVRKRVVAANLEVNRAVSLGRKVTGHNPDAFKRRLRRCPTVQ